MGVTAQMIGIQAYQMHQFLDAGIHIHLSLQAVNFKRLHEYLLYGSSGIQAGRRILENDLGLFPHIFKLFSL